MSDDLVVELESGGHGPILVGHVACLMVNERVPHGPTRGRHVAPALL
jgi:hypothetical protein